MPGVGALSALGAIRLAENDRLATACPRGAGMLAAARRAMQRREMRGSGGLISQNCAGPPV